MTIVSLLSNAYHCVLLHVLLQPPPPPPPTPPPLPQSENWRWQSKCMWMIYIILS